MKRILCLIDTIGPGGAQRQMVGLAQYLKEAGYCVKVAAYYDNQFYIGLLKTAGVEYDYIPQAQKGLLRQWHLMRYIQKEHADVVISYLESPSIRACVAHLFNHSFKLIVSERNTTQRTGFKERVRFNLFRLADYVVPNAFSQADYINKSFPFLSNKIKTIPNFVDLVFFTPPKEKQRKTIPEIMIAATIWASKNTLDFIDAVAQLKETGKRFHISWYGKSVTSTAYFNQCQEKIERLDLTDYITLKEKTSQIKSCYQSADFFCLPSFFEGTPNVICEAMACGLPVICSDVCDNPNYVIEGENGFRFNPHDQNSIVVAFEKLFALTESEFSQFCKQSRTLAEKKLSKESFVKSYIEIIEN